jgi:hypothetical protein
MLLSSWACARRPVRLFIHEPFIASSPGHSGGAGERALASKEQPRRTTQTRPRRAPHFLSITIEQPTNTLPPPFRPSGQNPTGDPANQTHSPNARTCRARCTEHTPARPTRRPSIMIPPPRCLLSHRPRLRMCFSWGHGPAAQRAQRHSSAGAAEPHRVCRRSARFSPATCVHFTPLESWANSIAAPSEFTPGQLFRSGYVAAA